MLRIRTVSVAGHRLLAIGCWLIDFGSFVSSKYASMKLDLPQAPHSQNNPDSNISYLILRLAIGVIGIMLPIVLIIGPMILEGCMQLQPSISHYYYSIMHVVFVFTLSCLGIFLVTYRSRDKFENIISNLAGLFSIGIAVFPTGYDGFNNEMSCQYIKLVPGINPTIGVVHYIFAILLFTCFSIFCLKIFQRPDEPNCNKVKKKRRNITYKLCGWVIVISMAAIAGFSFYHKKHPNVFPYSTFVFETTALVFFGISWFLKGTLLWKNSKALVLKYFR